MNNSPLFSTVYGLPIKTDYYPVQGQQIYRDYPRPPSLVLRKEYFDFPQRDSHAVHYIYS